MYDRVFHALTSTGLMDEYGEKFRENKMDDLTLTKCLQDFSLLTHFNGVMPVVGDRIKFIDAFQKIDMQPNGPLWTGIKKENLDTTPPTPPPPYTPGLAIGIDLGTTNCRVGIFLDGRVHVIQNEEGQPATPCHVAFFQDDQNQILVGEKAREEALRSPTSVIFDVKRLLGRKFSDPVLQKNLRMWPFTVVDGGEDAPKIKISTNFYHPEEICGAILSKMKKMAENHLNQPRVTNAVITVPAFFNDGQRQATKDAATIAGLNVLKILNEPAAAVIAHQFQREMMMMSGQFEKDDKKKNLLIFDLGGGTLDVAVIGMTGSTLTTLAVHGDSRLGGQDFDVEMVKNCIDTYERNHGNSREPTTLSSGSWSGHQFNMNHIQQQCQMQNQNLSNLPRGHKVNVSIGGDQISFTSESFNALNQNRFDQCLSIVGLTLAQAGLTKSQIDDVILVGGSTKIPRVREMLTKFFDGRLDLTLNSKVDHNPEEAVIFGAAIQAALLSGQEVNGFDIHSNPVRDVTPMSIGVRIVDGSLNVIVPKGTPIPCTLTKQYHKIEYQQTRVNIQIYEGENHRVASWNHFLGQFQLTGIPLGPPTAQPLDTTMTISDEGILNVRAVVRSNGYANQISVSTQKKRMTRAQIEEARRRLESLNIF